MLEDFPPASTPSYPWDEWLNGQPWELRRGDDFAGKVPTLRATAKSQAKKRGGTLRTRSFSRDDGEYLVVQFRPLG
jgi:hypothetical protein